MLFKAVRLCRLSCFEHHSPSAVCSVISMKVPSEHGLKLMEPYLKRLQRLNVVFL